MPEPTPSYRKLMAKADELRKCDSKLTSPQAFAKAYENPANRDLVQQYKREQAGRLALRFHSRQSTTIKQTLNLNGTQD
jgi:hypothetical protein